LIKHNKERYEAISILDSLLEGMKETNQMVDKYLDFSQIIHYPNGIVESLPLITAVNKFLDNRTDNLEYFLSTELDLVKKEINIHIIPKVESA